MKNLVLAPDSLVQLKIATDMEGGGGVEAMNAVDFGVDKFIWWIDFVGWKEELLD